MQIKKKILFFLLSLVIYCAIAEAAIDTPLLPSSKQDPLESINRHIFQFNQEMDTVLITPIATIYDTLVPNPIKKGANNFFDNIAMISTTGNDLLQGQFTHAIQDTWRFLINSTLGLAGTIDVASAFGLPKHFNDMGLTFARWGYKNSTYIVIPILGPATIRDTAGLFGDYYLLSPYPYIRSSALIYGILTYRYFTIRANLLDANKLMNDIALDPYIFERDAYYQYRQNKMRNVSADTSQYMYLQEKEPQDTDGADYISE